MTKFLLWLFLALAGAAQAATTASETLRPPELRPAQQQSQAAHLAAELLNRYHYKPVPLDDAMSVKIFDRYLKALDSEKLFFVQTDIDQWTGARAKLDKAIIKEDLSIPFAIFNLYSQRASERFAYARSLLREGFDFRQNESFQYERKNESWPKSEAEMRELWRKRVKNDWLRLKLAGKDDKGIVDTLDRRYENSLKRVLRVKSEDAFEIFMNAYTMAIDPHTNYMGPRAAADFDISMKLSLVGIGAVLTERDEYTAIRELVAGGPASLSGKLKSGDRILGVAQGANGVMTDILGWRLDDVVALIRGEADSVVVLDVLPAEAGPDGKHVLVSLVRKKISLEDQAAKKSVLSVMDGKAARRIGVITLPTFYRDVAARQKGDADFRSATRDVAQLLEGLKREKVDGVLIDLRNNGGGSLTEAVRLTGLFIGKGPVVQERDAQGNVNVERDARARIAWTGPLGVLINRGSASASEIFAAAIQDYGRGLVIGEPSYGKGTVQTMINLDQVAKNDKQKFGELKLTIAQFFRINGGTTQLRGVTPDILFPSATDPESFGESSFDNALPWAQVNAVDYSPAGDLKDLRSILMTRHDARVRNDREFQYLQEDIAESRRQRKKNAVSLNEEERRKERDAQEAKLASREKFQTAGPGAHERIAGREAVPGQRAAQRDDGLQANERNLAVELAAEKARKNAKDVWLHEAAHILGDEVVLLESGARFAARAMPGPALLANPQPALEGARGGIR